MNAQAPIAPIDWEARAGQAAVHLAETRFANADLMTALRRLAQQWRCPCVYHVCADCQAAEAHALKMLAKGVER